jgi:two-component system phosphate regulon sensor histidine kinase PhoR
MGGGMGIGLRLVKELVTALNGRIELLSEPGRGSVFKVVLPKSVEPVSV